MHVQVTQPLQATNEDAAAVASASTPSNSSSSSSDNGPHHKQQQQQLDKSGWWSDVARTAYAAVDDSLDGFEDLCNAAADTAESNALGGLTGPEAEMVKVSRVAASVVLKMFVIMLLS
jgi:hypothetical protein